MGRVKLWTGRYHATTSSRFVSTPLIKIPGARPKSNVSIAKVIREIRETARASAQKKYSTMPHPKSEVDKAISAEKHNQKSSKPKNRTVRPLEKCDVCDQKVRKSRLAKHMLEVHASKIDIAVPILQEDFTDTQFRLGVFQHSFDIGYFVEDKSKGERYQCRLGESIQRKEMRFLSERMHRGEEVEVLFRAAYRQGAYTALEVKPCRN